MTATAAAGNHVVVAMGHDRYALYAHLQPGSVRVKVGQRVATGQTLGLLGSSGSSNAPHLHFQLMDSPGPLGSNGIPYRFSRFSVAGTLTNFGGLFEGERANVAPRFAGPHRDQLPLNLQVVGFGG
jgi:murein DD-endopeptidase MepM/ murein hydrolase activator NlpD